ncbi:hypothetical protein [Clostridium phage XP41-N3]|nr:hypothetical protein [Clostridium phage XP41-N3]
MAMTEGLGVTPVYNLDNRNDDGMFGGGGAWIFFLFFLLAWGGNGFGGFGGANGTVGQINNDFMYSNLSNQLGRMQDQNTFISNSLQQGLCNLGYENLSNFKDLQAQLSNCCCETNRNIDAVRYENAQNTCAIIQASEKNADRIINHLTQSEIQSLRDSLNTANLQLSQQAQTANLISTLRPCPIPAYPSYSPYTSAFNSCGLGNGCGCGLV